LQNVTTLANQIVVDVGGKNVNGSLRNYFNSCNFICVDLEQHESVDIVIKPGDSLPFEDASVDIIVSTSCFEHDPCFWITFKEMCRILKTGGYIYINAPSSGHYHGYPGDNWRFYKDAGQALAYWSGICNYPVNVEESFTIDTREWDDFVCVFKRSEIKETEIVKNTKNGKLENKLLTHGLLIK
jgi:SAM-dependent methyltransferase